MTSFALRHGYGRILKMRPLGILRLASRQLKTSSVLSKNSIEEEEEAVPFRNTRAATWKNSDNLPPATDVPAYQPLIIGLSVLVFLVYFLVLREENDIDSELGESLYERIPGLEETQLNIAIRFNKNLGRDVTSLEKRLAEVVAEK